MSSPTSHVRRTYGVSSNADDRARATNESQQLLGETLTVSATANARRFKGPKRGGHFSLFTRNLGASGATSLLTLWYSNLPDPDPAVDSHWVQDAAFTAIDLTVADTSYFHNVGNVYAEWIRVKPVVASSAGALVQWMKTEDHAGAF